MPRPNSVFLLPYFPTSCPLQWGRAFQPAAGFPAGAFLLRASRFLASRFLLLLSVV